MSPHVPRSKLLWTLASVALLLGAAQPARSSPTGSPCTGHSASALDQYCEDIPAASGPAAPGVGTPALAPTLPVRLRAELRGEGSRSRPALRARRRLLTLPAPGPSHPLGGAAAAGVSVSGWSLFAGLVLVLLGSAVGLGTIEFVRRRRARSQSSGST